MREKMVTRTVVSTVVTMVTLDLKTMTPETATYTLPIDSDDDKVLLKYAKKAFETDTMIIVKVTFEGTSEKLYGMTEIKFLENAVELDPETRKPLN